MIIKFIDHWFTKRFRLLPGYSARHSPHCHLGPHSRTKQFYSGLPFCSASSSFTIARFGAQHQLVICETLSRQIFSDASPSSVLNKVSASANSTLAQLFMVRASYFVTDHGPDRSCSTPDFSWFFADARPSLVASNIVGCYGTVNSFFSYELITSRVSSFIFSVMAILRIFSVSNRIVKNSIAQLKMIANNTCEWTDKRATEIHCTV